MLLSQQKLAPTLWYETGGAHLKETHQDCISWHRVTQLLSELLTTSLYTRWGRLGGREREREGGRGRRGIEGGTEGEGHNNMQHTR